MDDITMSESDWFEGDEEEVIEDIEDDNDEAFFEEIIPENQIKKSYQVLWKTHSTAHITAVQEAESTHVANILGFPKQHAATLLRHFKWKKDILVEKYMDNSQKVLKEAGVIMQNQPKLEAIKGFCCDICCDDTPGLLSLSLDCNHRFCKDCWSQYVTGKIVGEGESRRIQCPGNNCSLIVDGSTVRSVVEDDTFERYETLLIRTYVYDHETIKWCPAPNCEFAIECSDITPPKTNQTVIPTVTCDCGHTFCFQCGLDAHLPCICQLTKLWLKKCKDDSETSNWLSANTKECIKCNTSIEKNGGCNHMTCRKCKHEFCWVCMGEWSIHGTSWYQCNKYDEKEGVEARDSEAKSRAALNRYLHYYTRYTNHEQSAKLDKELYEKTEKKMKTILDNTTELSWIQVQFLKEAVEILLSARKTLQYTYAFAYYLLKDENSTIIFEQNQRDLEMVVEQLSELLEKPFILEGEDTGDKKGKMNILEMKQDIMNKSVYVTSRREILLKDCCDGLLERRWKYNIKIE